MDRSLLLVKDDRYRLLETLREYGRERLAEVAEAAAYERRHAEHLLALAEAAEAGSRSPRHVAWVDRLEDELDNLRAALAWCERSDPKQHLRLAVALWWFWTVRGQYAEGRAALGAALARGGTSSLRGTALIQLGTLVRIEGEFEESRRLIEEGLALLRACGERQPVAFALHTLGVAHTALGDLAEARAGFEESLAHYLELDEPWGVAVNRLQLGRVLLRAGDLAAARPPIEQAVTVLRELERGAYTAEALLSLGVLARLEGDDAQAETSLREALAVARRARSRLALPPTLEGLAGVAASTGQPERALRLAGAAAALREAVGLRVPPWWPGLVDSWLAPAREALSRTGARAQEGRGRRMGPDEAVAYALGEGADGELTPRELEVVALVARGLTNREIAARLGVSVRTAEGHVERVRAKLGFRTRAQIGVWAAENR